jgi:ligand-binding sensor domain-containing protein
MNKINLHITLLLFLIWSFSFAQQYTNYSTKNGLPSNHVYRITQDYKGFIWFITDKGMAKFNGTEFKVFTTKEGLPSNDIWDIRITPDNKIWFFTKASKLGYIDNDVIYTFESEDKNEILYPVVINQNGNNINFYSNNKYYELENKKWTSLPEKSNSFYLEKIIHYKYKSISYINNLDSIFLIENNNKKKHSLLLNKERTVEYRGQVNDSLFIWITKNQIQILDLNNLTIKRIKDKAHSDKFRITRYSAVNNNIQFSGENFVVFLGDDYQFNKYQNIPKELKSHFSFFDRNSNLWIATATNGVYYLPKEKQQAKYQFKDLKVGKINSTNNAIFTSIYNKGFYKYNNQLKQFEPFIEMSGYMYSASYISELDLSYFLSNLKAVQLKNKMQKQFDNFEVARGLVFYKGFLYGNSSYGLSKISPLNFKKIKDIQQTGIRDLEVLNNKLLIATSNGIKYYKNDTILPIQTLIQFDKPIISITKLGSDNLIVSTDGFGAYITDLKQINILEKSEYLDVSSAFVYQDKIYLATSQGVWYYKKDQNNYKLIRKFTINDGLNSNKINSVYIEDNSLITSSNSGVSSIPLNGKKAAQFIDIYFDKVFYNKQKITDSLQVRYATNNQLHVNILTIDFTENAQHNYIYQLKPVQNKWTKTNSSQLLFNNLAPNQYELTIKSNNKLKTIHFTILPLWYQRLITKLIFTLFFLSLLITVVLNIRKRELKKQQKKLAAQKKLADFELHALRSQMNPHFVFNSLNAIQYYITKNEIDLSEKYLVKFSRLIRMFFDFSREKEISLSEEIRLLKGYLEIEKMRFGDDFKYKFNIDKKLDIQDSKIPTMLLQPIVENAVNHGIFHNGGKGCVEISFIFIENNTYQIIIKDDGVGIKKSKEIQNKSLKNNTSKTRSSQVLTERIDLLNQSKKWNVAYKLIDSFTVNSGTTVQLTFKKNE